MKDRLTVQLSQYENKYGMEAAIHFESGWNACAEVLTPADAHYLRGLATDLEHGKAGNQIDGAVIRKLLAALGTGSL